MYLLEWSERVGLMDERRARVMTQKAEASPDEAQHVLERAVSLRALIHSIFWALAHGQMAADGDLARLNALLPLVLSKQRVIRGEGVFTWGWDEQDEGLDRMLWPIVRAAAELLMAPDLRWLKVCEGEDCDRLFLDLSRNHSRRWCEMQHCGMLAKSRRHYAKKRLSRVRTT
jgi:predicted RNA-binding Zn ribbon-like protein